MDWYLKALRQYAEFEGRARRKEYWMFVLVNLLIGCGLAVLDSVLHWTTSLGYGRLSGFYELAMLVPSLAVGARRLHDIGRSGWWQLIVLVPFAGVIVLIVFFAIDGQAGSNEYGADPKTGETSGGVVSG
jgi:uncharacterized membrane protein YhaH (DUF805 family)